MKTNIKLLNWRREHKGYYVLRLKWIHKAKKEDMESWLSDNCSFNWGVYYGPYTRSYCAFENEIDAVAFKLRWL